MATRTLYWKSTCTTCRDAKKALEQRGVAFTSINYAKTPLTVEAVRSLVAAAGSVAAVLNARHEIAKAKNWSQTPPSPAVYAAAVVEQPNLIRRPLLVDGARIIIGFDRDAYAALK